ncbi:hypothetical protein VE00_08414 [Pseudogymnoascus sp. WSF 3629]|nr:hypothetical protein VE00_08414 [Pseudogymnoascus sp. WSF 3629]
MHRCAQLARSTRRVCRGDVGYAQNTTPVAVIFRSCFSTARARHSSVPTSSTPPTPRKSSKTTTFLLTTLTLAAAGATTYQLSSSSSTPSSGLHDRIFTPYTITSKTPISPTSTIFTLSPPPSTSPPPSSTSDTQTKTDPFAPLWPSIWSLTFRQPQLQVARSYTPLPPPPSTTSPTTTSPLPTHPPGALRFLIRREHGGEVSTYLSHLPVGSTIDIRGPVVEYAIPPDVSDVVFLAGGTGIAPALQVVRAILGSGAEGEGVEGDKDNNKMVKILWANRQRSECAGAPVPAPSWWRIWSSTPSESEQASPLVEELRGVEARYPGRVEVKYFIDAEGSFIDRRGILDAVKSSAKEGRGEEKGGRKLIMVAGPDGFVKHYVGPRVWEGGEEKQGPLGGVVKGLGVRGWEVVKL